MFRLTPYKTNQVARREDTMDNLFDNFFNDTWFQPVAPTMKGMKVDIQELEDSYLVEAELPGFEKEEISISLEKGLLTIHAERQETADDQQKNYIRRERRQYSYTRSFVVEDIKEEMISAKYDKGMLNLELPKVDEKVSTSRQININ